MTTETHADLARARLFWQEGLRLRDASEAQLVQVFVQVSTRIQQLIVREMLGRSTHTLGSLCTMLEATPDRSLQRKLLQAIARHSDRQVKTFTSFLDQRGEGLRLMPDLWWIVYRGLAEAPDATLDDLQKIYRSDHHCPKGRDCVRRELKRRLAALTDSELSMCASRALNSSISRAILEEFWRRRSWTVEALVDVAKKTHNLMDHNGLCKLIEAKLARYSAKRVWQLVATTTGKVQTTCAEILVEHPHASLAILLELYECGVLPCNIINTAGGRLQGCFATWKTNKLLRLFQHSESARIRRLCFPLLAKREDCPDEQFISAWKCE